LQKKFEHGAVLSELKKAGNVADHRLSNRAIFVEKVCDLL